MNCQADIRDHWKWTEIILSFLRLHPHAAFLTLVGYEHYSISSEEFFPAVVDVMVIRVKFAHPSSFSSLIPKMSMFTLVISCFTTSNLPWYMDLTLQVPMPYCSWPHWTSLPSPVTSTTGCCFGSVLSFFLDICLHSSPVEYWAPTDLGSSSFSGVSFAFSYCSWGSQGKNTKVVCHSLLQWTTFSQTSPLWPTHLGGPTGHGLVSLS